MDNSIFGDDDAASTPITTFSHLTIIELKKELKSLGLGTKGNKAALMDRLSSILNSTQERDDFYMDMDTRIKNLKSAGKDDHVDNDSSSNYCPMPGCTAPCPATWILCENSSCGSWYHLQCLNLKAIPKGKWICHYCKHSPILDDIHNISTTTTNFITDIETCTLLSSDWLFDHLVAGGMIEKAVLYNTYVDYCLGTCTPLNEARFGKLVKELFPDIKTRRLRIESLGASKYHFVGIQLKQDNSSQTHTDFDFISIISSLKQNISTLKHCPKACRTIIAQTLKKCIDLCITENSLFAWHLLLVFPYIVLQTLPKEKQVKNSPSLNSKIKGNLAIFDSLNIDTYQNFLISLSSKNSAKKTFKNSNKIGPKVTAKVSQGDIRGAVRLLSSDDSIAPNTPQTLQSLIEKHPSQSTTFNNHDTSYINPYSATKQQVKMCILGFPNDSAGGLDSLRPQVVKDLISTQTGDFGIKLIESLTNLCNFMLNGKVRDDICPLLYGASLTALSKKSGGIRPIAVGCIYRRLVSKIGVIFMSDRFAKYFSPIQVGFGVKNGAEAGAHSARRFFNHPHATTTAFLKIDYKNAFNMVDRTVLLDFVHEKAPELYLYLEQCYRSSSILSWNSNIISSSRGIQQGDPLGPALFCLAIHPLISELRSSFNLWYLDDGTLGGEPVEVLKDFHHIIESCHKIGLELNFDKCEFTLLGPEADNNVIANDFRLSAPGIKDILSNKAELLGAPLTLESAEILFRKKITSFQTMINRLNTIPSHVAYYLLKHSLAIPRLVYMLRSAPMFKLPHLLDEFDSLLKSALENITNCSIDSSSFKQVSLPVHLGGLGIRHTTSLATPCFLSSSFSSSNLVSQILPLFITAMYDNYVMEAQDLWKLISCNDLPDDLMKCKQAAWESPIFSKISSELLASSKSEICTARILANRVKESGAWLNALPSRNLGTLLDNDSFRIAIGLRMGSKLCFSHKCKCGLQVDEFGLHGLKCKKSSGRLSRHNHVNELIKRALVSGSIPCVREPLGCSRADGKRPDGLTLVPYSKGRSLIWDFTCIDTFAGTYINNTTQRAGAAADLAESNKIKKYEELMNTFIFVPVAIETSGVWGQAGLQFIKQIGNRIREATGEKASTNYLIQRISIAIQQGNAAAILGSFPESKGLEEVFYIINNNLTRSDIHNDIDNDKNVNSTTPS
jgi:hypothetical protein